MKRSIFLSVFILMSLMSKAQCNLPTGLFTNNINTASVTVNWTIPSGSISTFEIRYRRNVDNPWTYVFASASSNSKVLTSLIGGTLYQWQVKTYCTGGSNSDFTSTKYFTTGIDYTCTPPSNTTASSIGATTATISWTAIVGTGVEYKVRYRKDTENNWTYHKNITTNSKVLTGLSSSTKYQYEVETECSVNNVTTSGFGQRKTFTTGIDYTCSPPSNPTTSSVGVTSATLTWTAIVGTGVEYKVRYRKDTENNWTYYKNITTNSKVLTGLSAGTKYQFEVETECSSDNLTTSGFGQRKTFTTGIDYTCSSPSNPTASSVGAATATLTWTAIVGTGVEYKVRYRKSSENPWTYIRDLTTNSATLSGLSPGGVEYQFEVETECSADNLTTSGFGQRKTFTTITDYVCSPPSNPSTSSIGINTATLTWTAIVGTGVEYKVRYRKDIENYWTYLTNINTNSKILTGLSAGTKYQFEVETECSADNLTTSGFGQRKTFYTTVDYSCTPPTNVTLISATSSSIDVAWDAISGTDVEYKLRYRQEIENPWTYVRNIPANSNTISGLTSGMKYQVEVETECNIDNTVTSGFGDRSFMYTETEVDCDGLEPNFRILSDTGFNYVTISWADMGAPVYDLEYRAVGDLTFTSVEQLSDTFYTISGLSQNETYQYRLRSDCSSDFVANLSNYTSIDNFSTRNCSPPTSGFGVSSITNNTANVNWTSVGGAEGYVVLHNVKGSSFGIYDTVFTSSTTLSGLNGGTTYRYEVRTICSAVDGLFSSFSTSPVGARHQFNTTGSSSCLPPSGLASSAVGADNVSLTWTTNGANRYDVSIKSTFETNWTTEGPADNISSHTYSSLYSGQTYFFRVRSVCSVSGDIVSDWSSPITKTTTGSNPCTTPTGIVISNQTSSGGTVSWNTAGNANSYSVRYKIGNASWTYKNNIALTSTNLTGLASSTAYDIQVKSVCNTGGVPESDFSGYYRLTTLSSSRNSDFNFVGNGDEFITVFPNPTQDELKIFYHDQKSSIIEIYTSNGDLIMSESIIGNEMNKVDVSNLSTGVYILKIFTSTETKIYKLNKI